MMGIRRIRRSTGALAALLLAGPIVLGPGAAEAQPASPQPSLPKPLDGAMPMSSPVIGGGAGGGSGGKDAMKDATKAAAGRRASMPRHRVAAHRRAGAGLRGDGLRGEGLRGEGLRGEGLRGEPLERPALAGVELVAPLPVPVQPPHFTVPAPAYLPENAATFYTTPLPPVVCRRVPRDPYAPDPHLIRETTVFCEADNP